MEVSVQMSALAQKKEHFDKRSSIGDTKIYSTTLHNVRKLDVNKTK